MSACRAIVPLILGLLCGCSSSSSGPSGGPSVAKDGGAPGTERSACYPNETCNAGLSCLSDLCVKAPAGSGGQPGASGGTTASGGSFTSGGTTGTRGAGGNAFTLDAGGGDGAATSSGGTGGKASTGGSGSGEPASDASTDGATASDSSSTEAGSGGSLCQAGHYVGTFSCNLIAGEAGTSGLTLQGSIDLRLSQAQGAKLLTVSTGTLGAAAGTVAMNATLSGQQSCRSGAFDATFADGTIAIPPFPPQSGFSGSFSGAFVQSGPKLTGEWTLRGNGSFVGYHCGGPWTATWQAG